MPKIFPFEKYAEQYERWFEKNRWVYEAELRAVKAMMPTVGRGVEIGVGTGRFAEPLGIKNGVEPSKRMRDFAQKRGIRALDGVAERLPFDDSQFDFVLMVTTVCFVDDISKALMEAHRVLSDGGVLIIGFVDRNSKMGKTYLERQKENVFYKEATFFSVHELVECMNRAGFTDLTFNQTIFGTLAETAEDEPVKPGHGEGSFLVIRGRKEQKDHSIVSLATSSQERLEKPGLVQKFLQWIARGAEESHTSRTSCPT
jgi:SAM-dependent methyltransferase